MGAGTSAGDAARSRRGTRQAPEADGQAVMEPGSGAAESTTGTAADQGSVTDAPDVTDAPGTADGTGTSEERGRRFSLTRDTARPEGGGRAAPSDAPAPARQWPLLSVLGTIGLGLLIVGTHPFAEAFRIGTILIGVALIGGAVLRRVLPSVGMLAVRSRFTDMLTYGLLGLTIVLLSLMTQPKPWLEIPFLEDVVHSTVP
ncbi:DUF3017 domain-containing protein [Streptomyces scopuliridis]|uniref:DUF3017 domain-containing protein n=1 Tax=Streptomyces scopuliridis TaxID=452529 RepID=A0ACD4ZIB8_9ACTN|nr:DUF3017 domain-containing protein [Streptomyces scopuliridis]WSB33948.1 DUF3017 domain-containing protein [Streptomyces scopuliridis]WSB98229.1 DUF3017 domain-containing protein [Streptomyces scopuliridis]WSC08069.1 DUF3017 domain-containing protein [Streptomyces scopuliridis]